MKALVTSRHFEPEEGPSRGLLRNYKSSCGPSKLSAVPQPGPHLTAYLGGGKSEAGLSVGSIMEAGTGEEEGEREPGAACHHHGAAAPVTLPGVSGPSVAELCSCSWSWSGSGSSPAVADCRSRLPSITEPPGDRRTVDIYTIYTYSIYTTVSTLQYLHYSIYSIYPPAVEAERVWSCQAGGGVTGAAHELIYHKPRARTRYSKEVEDVGCWHCSGVTELRPGELSQLSGPGSAAVLWPLVVHCSTGATGATTATLRLRHSSPRLS